jgi:hypothetical protein
VLVVEDEIVFLLTGLPVSAGLTEVVVSTEREECVIALAFEASLIGVVGLLGLAAGVLVMPEAASIGIVIVRVEGSLLAVSTLVVITLLAGVVSKSTLTATLIATLISTLVAALTSTLAATLVGRVIEVALATLQSPASSAVSAQWLIASSSLHINQYIK